MREIWKKGAIDYYSHFPFRFDLERSNVYFNFQLKGNCYFHRFELVHLACGALFLVDTLLVVTLILNVLCAIPNDWPSCMHNLYDYMQKKKWLRKKGILLLQNYNTQIKGVCTIPIKMNVCFKQHFSFSGRFHPFGVFIFWIHFLLIPVDKFRCVIVIASKKKWANFGVQWTLYIENGLKGASIQYSFEHFEVNIKSSPFLPKEKKNRRRKCPLMYRSIEIFRVNWVHLTACGELLNGLTKMCSRKAANSID